MSTGSHLLRRPAPTHIPRRALLKSPLEESFIPNGHALSDPFLPTFTPDIYLYYHTPDIYLYYHTPDIYLYYHTPDIYLYYHTPDIYLYYQHPGYLLILSYPGYLLILSTPRIFTYIINTPDIHKYRLLIRILDIPDIDSYISIPRILIHSYGRALQTCRDMQGFTGNTFRLPPTQLNPPNPTQLSKYLS